MVVMSLLLRIGYHLYQPESTTNVASFIGEIPPKFNNTTLFLLPATHKDKHLCKTLLTATVLGYPTPDILAWGEQVTKVQGTFLFGDGIHLAKISKTLEYLEHVAPQRDNDLVLMIDAYDVWFQFGPHVLLERYHRINTDANARLKRRLGHSYEQATKQIIIFGAGKRCALNDLSSTGCYPLPD